MPGRGSYGPGGKWIIELMKTNSSSKRMKDKLNRLQMRKAPTPENVIRAMSTYNPKLILEEADRLKNGSSDSNTDGDNDGYQGH